MGDAGQCSPDSWHEQVELGKAVGSFIRLSILARGQEAGENSDKDLKQTELLFSQQQISNLTLYTLLALGKLPSCL